jgi:ribosomal-protein-alanine N-acetyltransferase
MLSRAGLADCDVMAAIHAAAFGVGDAWSSDLFRLQLALPNVIGLLDPSGGLILLRIAGDEAEILTVAVEPETRRRGIGSTLLTEATTMAASLSVRSVFLEVSTNNIAAQQMYSRSGFTQIGRRPNYYSDQSDALVLRLELNSTD